MQTGSTGVGATQHRASLRHTGVAFGPSGNRWHATALTMWRVARGEARCNIGRRGGGHGLGRVESESSPCWIG
jgi:hypothetical protein